MKWLVPGTLVLSFLCAAVAVGDGGAAKRALAQLQGTWTVQSVESDLGARPQADLKDERIIVQGQRWIRQGGHKEGGEDWIEIAPSGEAGAIDFVYPRAGKQGEDLRFPGRYHLDGDTLKIVVNFGGRERPKEFKVAKDTYVSVYQRAKRR
jgi:uncharacterized protein (TIGR03067 family)